LFLRPFRALCFTIPDMGLKPHAIVPCRFTAPILSQQYCAGDRPERLSHIQFSFPGGDLSPIMTVYSWKGKWTGWTRWTQWTLKINFQNDVWLLRPFQNSASVIPAEAGIQNLRSFLDTGFRRCDCFLELWNCLYCLPWRCNRGSVETLHCNVSTICRESYFNNRGRWLPLIMTVHSEWSIESILSIQSNHEASKADLLFSGLQDWQNSTGLFKENLFRHIFWIYVILLDGLLSAWLNCCDNSYQSIEYFWTGTSDAHVLKWVWKGGAILILFFPCTRSPALPLCHSVKDQHVRGEECKNFIFIASCWFQT
jgi:hypothetical protein